MKFLGERGIGCGIHYPLPIHLQPSMARWNGKKGDLPEAEAIANRIVSLPIFPELTDDEVRQVIAAVRIFLWIRPRINVQCSHSYAQLQSDTRARFASFDRVRLMMCLSWTGIVRMEHRILPSQSGVRVEKQFDHDDSKLAN
jgi:hypothetical protein